MPKRKDILELSKQSVKRRCNQYQDGGNLQQCLQSATLTHNENDRSIRPATNEFDMERSCEDENITASSTARQQEHFVLEEWFGNENFSVSSICKKIYNFVF